MNRFTRTCTTRERLCATLRIENFSMYLCKGFFSSPVLETESKQSKWSFSVLAEDGDDYGNFMTVLLKNEDREVDELSVEVTVSIVDCFGWNDLTEEKKVVFNRSDHVQIFSVTKDQMVKNCSLNRKIFLPNDVLTLQCELVIHKDEVFRFSTKEEFDDNQRNVRSLGMSSDRKYFLRSHFTEQSFDFTSRIDEFSIHGCKGRHVCPGYESETSNGKWSLVLYVDDSNFGHDFLSIGLERSKSCKGELVEVKLSVMDDSDNILLSAKKRLYFTDCISMEKKILYITKQDRERLIPNDTLNLNCEVCLCQENVSTFATKEELDTHIQYHDGYDDGQISQLMKYSFLIFLFVASVTTTAFNKVMYRVPTIWNYTLAAAGLARRGFVIAYYLGHFIGYLLGITKKPSLNNFFVRFHDQIMRSGLVLGICWIFKNIGQIVKYLFSNGQYNNSQHRGHTSNRNAIVPYRGHDVVPHRERNNNRRNYINADDSDLEYYPNQENRNWNYSY